MEQKINGCLSPKKYHLKFDIYIPEINSYIEYDGIQHFKINEKWGGEEGYNYRKICDKIKDDFCYENNIKLHRISLDNIEEKLNGILKQIKNQKYIKYEK